jgi:hypothetical protein
VTLIQRTAFVVFAVTVKEGNTANLAYFSGVQALYLFYIITAMPFYDWKDNFCKITNEILLVVLILPLFHYKNEQKWTSTPEWIYLSIIAGTSLIVTLNHAGKQTIFHIA